MSPRKRRPVLFEVARKTPAPPDPLGRAANTQRDPRPVEPRTAVEARPPAPRTAAEPAVERFELRMGWPGIFVATAAMVVLLAVMFAAGRQFERAYPTPVTSDSDANDLSQLVTDPNGDAAADGDSDTAQGDPPVFVDDDPDDSAQREPVEPPDQANDRPVLNVEPGKFYIVVQHFPRSKRADALEAGRFFMRNGLGAATVTGADIRLVIVQPFDSERAARPTIRRVKQLGKEYASNGYTFDAAYAVKLRAE